MSKRSLMLKLVEFHIDNPITERGDVRTLIDCFDGDMTKFVYEWALREPALVKAFYKGGFRAVEKVGKIKYEFIPKLAVRWLKLDKIQSWAGDVVESIAEALKQNKPHTFVMKLMKQLPGFAGTI